MCGEIKMSDSNFIIGTIEGYGQMRSPGGAAKSSRSSVTALCVSSLGGGVGPRLQRCRTPTECLRSKDSLPPTVSIVELSPTNLQNTLSDKLHHLPAAKTFTLGLAGQRAS